MDPVNHPGERSGDSLSEALREFNDSETAVLIKRLVTERISSFYRQDNPISPSLGDSLIRQEHETGSETQSLLCNPRDLAIQMLNRCENGTTDNSNIESLNSVMKYEQEIDAFSARAVRMYESRLDTIAQEICDAIQWRASDLRDRLTHHIRFERDLR